MLWLALHLPQLPLEVHTRASERPLPAVVAAPDGGRSRVLSANAQAARDGVYPGLALSAAHALVAGLHVYRRDTDAERAALEQLATLGLICTPVVSVSAPHTVLLEVEGSLKLFGGAERLLQRLHAEVRRLGYSATLAMAPTPFGAELLARAGRSTIVRDPDGLRTMLHRLPLSVFELAEDQHIALRDIGVRSLRDLMRLPRAGLARRFGAALIDNMDRALGHRPDPRAPFVAPEQFSSTLHFPDAVVDAEALLFTARRQLLELSAFLQARAAGVREVTWQLQHWRQPPSVLRIESALVHRNARRFLDLLREQFNRQPLAGAVESIELHAAKLERHTPETASLLAGGGREQAHDRTLLVERLRTRLGVEAVQGVDLIADRRPEFAQHFRSAGNEGGVNALRKLTPTPFPTISRPLWLLPEPTPLAASGAQPQWQGGLTLESGPERIETGWWDQRPVARDYYVARAPSGTRLWIYRERPGFTRGRARSISPQPTTPRWFLHGLFS